VGHLQRPKMLLTLILVGVASAAGGRPLTAGGEQAKRENPCSCLVPGASV